LKLAIGPGFGLAAALGDGRLAVADPASVPAGKYARAALESLGVWLEVASRLAPAEDVRAALRLVARGEAPLGIVYRTDAAADPDVLVVGAFPASSHPPIVYPAAMTRRAGYAAARVLACLAAPASMPAFARWGFTAPVGRTR
jgi:molybdate transport system substrate-binding protein